MEQNIYPGIRLFSASQQRETGQPVSVGQFFSHTATLHVRERAHTHRKPLTAGAERERERKDNAY